MAATTRIGVHVSARFMLFLWFRDGPRAQSRVHTTPPPPSRALEGFNDYGPRALAHIMLGREPETKTEGGVPRT